MRKICNYFVIIAILLSFVYFPTLHYHPVKASVNDFSRSIYIHQGEDMYKEGYYYRDGNPNDSCSIIILDFGAPQYGSNGYGIGKFGSGYGQYTPFFGTDSIKTDVENFIRGYNDNLTRTKDMELAIGFNTSVDRVYGDHGEYGGTFYAFGRNLKTLLCEIVPEGHITEICAAIDAEQGSGWMKPYKVNPILNGYNESRSYAYYTMYDFGDDELGTNLGNTSKNGWTAENIWFVAYKADSSSPIPEIYYPGTEDEWAALSLWAYNNKGGSIFFTGVLSENGYANSYTDSQSYYALLNALRRNINTYQSSFVYNSWMEPKYFSFSN